MCTLPNFIAITAHKCEIHIYKTINIAQFKWNKDFIRQIHRLLEIFGKMDGKKITNATLQA